MVSHIINFLFQSTFSLKNIVFDRAHLIFKNLYLFQVIYLLDPWTADSFDYDKIIKQFGIADFQDELKKIKDPHRLMRRGIIFGQRDFDKIIKLINLNEPFALVTGMMPSGPMHIGHKMVIDQLIWYHNHGAKLSIPIADLEAYAARGISFEKGKKIAVDEYLTNYIALGLDLTSDDVDVYLQSQNRLLHDLTFRASLKANFNELKAIYGFTPSTNLAHVNAPLTQVADILIPQTEENGGPINTVVPVGIDQDPHIRLTRDITSKLKEELGFITPSSTYHRFLTGLTGDKMSSSKPKTAIYLNDETKDAVKKLKSAKTGGRESLQEQKEKGGQPNQCVIFEMLLYHLIDDDKKLEEIREQCMDGTLLCGVCKNMTSELLEAFLDKHHEKQVEAKEIAKTIL